MAKRVQKLEEIFARDLSILKDSFLVKDVRNIGAIGVIELKDDIYASKLQEFCVENEVWLCPFKKSFYSIVALQYKPKKLLKNYKTMILGNKTFGKNIEENQKNLN